MVQPPSKEDTRSDGLITTRTTLRLVEVEPREASRKALLRREAARAAASAQGGNDPKAALMAELEQMHRLLTQTYETLEILKQREQEAA
jgi:hypothetical protein